MPGSIRRQLKKKKKKRERLPLQVGVRARMVYSSSSHELTWTSKGWGARARFALTESKALAQQLRPFHIFNFFCFCFDQLRKTEQGGKLLFIFFVSFHLDTIIRIESALKVPPINHYSRSLAPSHKSAARVHSKGTAGNNASRKKEIRRHIVLRHGDK